MPTLWQVWFWAEVTLLVAALAGFGSCAIAGVGENQKLTAGPVRNGNDQQGVFFATLAVGVPLVLGGIVVGLIVSMFRRRK